MAGLSQLFVRVSHAFKNLRRFFMHHLHRANESQLGQRLQTGNVFGGEFTKHQEQHMSVRPVDQISQCAVCAVGKLNAGVLHHETAIVLAHIGQGVAVGLCHAAGVDEWPRKCMLLGQANGCIAKQAFSAWGCAQKTRGSVGYLHIALRGLVPFWVVAAKQFARGSATHHSGQLDWFMLRARVFVEGLEVGDSIVGGFMYEDARETLRDGTAEDLIYQAIEEAKPKFYRLSRVFGGLSEQVDRAEI